MGFIIQAVVLFILTMLYLFSFNSGDNSNWGKALLLAIALPSLAIIPDYLGVIGWFIALSLSLWLISKVLGQSISGSFLILIVLGLVEYLVLLGIHRYIA